MDRRTFLKRGLATSASGVLLGSTRPGRALAAPNDPEKMKRIYSVELWAPNYYPPDPVGAVNEMSRTITENI